MSGGRGGFGHLASEVGAGIGLTRREPMEAFEVARVLEWRARTRAGWQACADYCGRPVEDVRKACEAVLRGGVAGMAAIPRPSAAASVQPARRGDPQARVLAALADGALTQAQIVEATGMYLQRVSPLIGAMADKGLVVECGKLKGPGRGAAATLWALSGRAVPAADRNRLAILAALEAGPVARPALAETAALSEPTVKRYIDQLVAEGTVIRRAGQGIHPALYALAGTPLPKLKVRPPVRSRAEWLASFRTGIEKALRLDHPLSRNEISAIAKASRPLVVKVVAEMVERGEAASAGFRRGRGHPEELFVRIARDA